MTLCFFGTMPRTVKLEDKLCFCAIKIGNILAENLLTRKANGISAQEIIPKVFFFLGHIISQHFGDRNNVFVMFSLHYNPSVLLRNPPPFTQGRHLPTSALLDKLDFM